MSRSTIKNQSGFSLIELMVVVAIIGILAGIGIPQMQKFQARARQSEAKAHLSTIFTAEQSFFSEWTAYTVDLKNAGAGATGTNLRYDAGFGVAAACIGYPVAGAPPETVGNSKMSANAPAGTSYYNNSAAVNDTMTTVGLGPVAGLANGGAAATQCTATSFSARTWGQPNNAAVSGGTMDVWGIDQNKLIANTFNGIQ